MTSTKLLFTMRFSKLGALASVGNMPIIQALFFFCAQYALAVPAVLFADMPCVLPPLSLSTSSCKLNFSD